MPNINWTDVRKKLLKDIETDVAPPKLAIPTISKVATDFARAADDPSSTSAKLASILDQDAALVIEVLKIVNSAATGLRQKVSSTRSAISLLGTRRTRMFVLTSGVKALSEKIRSPYGDASRFGYAAMQRAILARRIADRMGWNADLAFSAALLQDFTLPSLTTERPDQYKGLLATMGPDVPSIAVAEKKRFGWDHAVAGARLMLAWNLPDDLVVMILGHHWLETVLDHPVLGKSELAAVTLSSLLPDPVDTRRLGVEQLSNWLESKLGIEWQPFQTWVAEDLVNAGLPPHPDLAWKSAN